jgi:hypothetical protein
MRESRRVFLGLAFGAVATAAAGTPRQLNVPPDPTRTPSLPPIASLPKHNREELTANQIGIKKDINRMSELVGELQKGLDDNDIKQVLSLDVIHKTEEIEKLAKHIRELVRG